MKLAFLCGLLCAAASTFADALTQIPAVGVNAWERGACMPASDFQALGANNVKLFRTGFNQEESASLDTIVQDAAAAGVQILPILHSYVMVPDTEPELAGFEQFAQAMAARYGPSGTFWFPGGILRNDIPFLPIRAWEVWNEPNLSAHWGGTTNAVQYFALLKRVGAAVHTVDPAAVIIFAGLALKGADANGHNGVTFLQTALAQPYATSTFQALSAHSYPLTPADIENHLSIMRSTLDLGGSNAEVWLTEFGWPTSGTTSDHPAVSTAVQSSNLDDTLTRINTRRTQYKLGPAVWFAYRDLTPGSANPCEAGFGVNSWSNYLGLKTSLTNGNTGKIAWTTIGTRAQSAPALDLPLPAAAADTRWSLIP